MKPHFGKEITDKLKMAVMIDPNDVTKHFKMMFFNCWNACHFYRQVLILKGYCLVAIKELLFGLSYNFRSYGLKWGKKENYFSCLK